MSAYISLHQGRLHDHARAEPDRDTGSRRSHPHEALEDEDHGRGGHVSVLRENVSRDGELVLDVRTQDALEAVEKQRDGEAQREDRSGKEKERSEEPVVVLPFVIDRNEARDGAPQPAGNYW